MFAFTSSILPTFLLLCLLYVGNLLIIKIEKLEKENKKLKLKIKELKKQIKK